MRKYGHSHSHSHDHIQHPPMIRLRAVLLLLVAGCLLFQVIVPSSVTTNLSNMAAVNVARRAEQEGPTSTPTTVDDNKHQILPLPPPLPLASINTTTIRTWGCARNETPFLFVHIGKAGGGGVRARLAASALNYSKHRGDWFREHRDPTYYYPVYDEQGTLHKGRFASSKLQNWVPPSLVQYKGDFAWEGHAPCGATTPLGQAIACPMETQLCHDPREGDSTSNNRCDLIYMGHNVLGSELHWLPTQYLLDWWTTHSPWGQSNQKDVISEALRTRNDPTINNGHWKLLDHVDDASANHLPPTTKVDCPDGHDYNHSRYWPSQFYEHCIQPKTHIVDQLATRAILGDAKSTDNANTDASSSSSSLHWAHMLSTLPVTRVTVVREPFSWLTSKFFWHGEHYSRNLTLISPDKGDLRNQQQLARNERNNEPPPPPFVKCDDIEEAATGWAALRATTYMVYLCGEHCWGGLAAGTLSLSDLEAQAAYHLRNSFAVVGLLQNTDEFYDMVTRRVFYMNTSLNPHVQGKKHGTGDLEEAQRCKTVYQQEDFQRNMMELSPEVAALVRLYHVAVEVNAFQREELSQCSTS